MGTDKLRDHGASDSASAHPLTGIVNIYLVGSQGGLIKVYKVLWEPAR